jgi:hypothetical protein
LAAGPILCLQLPCFFENVISKRPKKRLRRVKPCPKHFIHGREVKLCDLGIWKSINRDYHPRKVFINVPYDKEYDLFRHTIYSTVKAAGLIPVFASERETSSGIRICKICELMQTCKYSISDVSFSRLHNMPFELGLLMGLGIRATAVILMNERYETIKVGGDNKMVRKFDSQLSNLKGVEVIHYDSNQKRLIKLLLCLATSFARK